MEGWVEFGVLEVVVAAAAAASAGSSLERGDWVDEWLEGGNKLLGWLVVEEEEEEEEESEG